MYLSQAIKKAKQFEIRKVVRRLKQAKENSDAAETKLEAYLVATRSADVDALVKEAAKPLYALLPSSAAGVAGGGEGTARGTEGSVEATLQRHILGAKCVTDELKATTTYIEELQKKAAKQAPKAELADAERERGPSSGEGTASPEGSDSEPDEIAQGALAKLLQQRSQKNSASSGPSSDADSGLIDEGHAMSSDNDAGDGDSSGGEENSSQDERYGLGSNGNVKQRPSVETKGGQQQKEKLKKVKKPPKPKNRLGQRARRKLALQTFGEGAAHLAKESRVDKELKTKRPSESAGKDGEEALHPSWAARRQQVPKLSIPPFQKQLAKKTTVGDSGTAKVKRSGGGSSGNAAAEAAHASTAAIHPSWELKKKLAAQQRLLQPSEGTKVVFDDSD